MKYFDTEEQLHFLEACSKGDRLEVEKLLRSGEIDVNFQHGVNKWTALHWAAKREHERICAILLNAGFDTEAVDIQNRQPVDVCSQNNIELRNLLKPKTLEKNNEMHDVESNCESKFTPGYIKYPNFPYSKQSSLDSGSTPSSPTTRGYYSYGRRDSATRTRFLLVRTSCGAGKEAFKRITLPGGSTVEELKKAVENAMKSGPVKVLMTLPYNVLIEEDSQIEAFDNCQKIDVIFGDPTPSETPKKISKPITTRRTSLQSQKRDDTPETSESSESSTCHPSFNMKPIVKAVPEDSSQLNGAVVTPPPTPHEETPPSPAHEESSPSPVQEEEEEEKIVPQNENEEVEEIHKEIVNTDNEIPAVQEPVEVTTDLYFEKEYIPSEVTENIPLTNMEQKNQDITDDPKKWTTAQQVAAVAAAASLVGLGCYIYKFRK